MLSACSTGYYEFGEEVSTPIKIEEQPTNISRLILQDIVVDSTIHTVLLKPEKWALKEPIIYLNSEEKLTIRFDDFSENLRRFSYQIVRCYSDWEETTENTQNFINGFINDYIDQAQYSQNTLVNFKHYSFVFPTDYSFTKSGNYALKVFDMETNQLAFIKRFQVLENKCTIEPDVKKASKLDDANYRQEIDFKISIPEGIYNPTQEIEVRLFKNGNRVDIRTNLKPIFIENSTLTYDFDEENVFDGGNEFRSLNIQSLRYNAENIARIEKTGNDIHVTLLEEKARTFAKYFSKEDLNGKLLIKNQDREPSDLTAEYVAVNFSLNVPQFLPDGDIYIFGELSDWQINDKFKLNYDIETKIYSTSLLLKQGFYDYEYVYVKKQSDKIDEAFIEGTHFQTQNEYTIQVFWKNRGLNEDFLIGSHTFLAH
ncbi:MAG: type IX secretion system plug protein domain-containing protein [Bacteroidia bacterium]